MAYTKNNFKDYNVLHASELNKMDNQIAKNESDLNELGGRVEEVLASIPEDYSQLSESIAEILDVEKKYIGYDGLAKKYGVGVGFYDANNIYHDSSLYAWIDLEIGKGLTISGCRDSGTVNLLDKDKNFVSNAKNWSNPNGKYYQSDLVAFVRISMINSDVDKCTLKSYDSSIDAAIELTDFLVERKDLSMEWELGSTSDLTGGDLSSTTRIRNKGKIDVRYASSIITSIANGYDYGINFFNHDTYLGCRNWISDNRFDLLTEYPNVTHVRFVIRIHNNQSISNIDEVSSKLNVQVLENNVQVLFGNKSNYDDVNIAWELDSINDISGNDTEGYKNRIRTVQKIDVSKYSKVSFEIENGYKYGIYAYDDNSFLGTKNWITDKTNNLFDIYPNATKLRLVLADTSNHDINDVELYAEKVTITYEYNNLGILNRNEKKIAAINNKVFDSDYIPPKMITLIDDDGADGFYNYLMPLAKELHIPISSCNVGIYATNGLIGHMQWDKLIECANSGMEICSHSNKDIGGKTYPIIDENGNQVMSDEEVLEDLYVSRNLMRTHGMNSDMLVYPNSSDHFEKIADIARLAGYKYGIGYTLENPRIYKRGEFDPYYLTRYDLDYSLLDESRLIGIVERMDNRTTGWMLLKMHTSFIDWNEPAKAETMVNNLRTMIQYAISHGSKFVTAEAGYNAYYV